jgi:uncharacterized protein YjbI with pentapeptide repeats
MITLPASCPYPGLRPFAYEDGALFFGRELHTRQLRQKLGRERFAAVVGSSGSGKSSLVKAGLLPLLDGEGARGRYPRWNWLTFRPGIHPIDSLVWELRLLAQRVAPDLAPGSIADVLADRWTTMLRRSSRGLRQAIAELWSAAKPDDQRQRQSILVVVDQFEELFRFEGQGAGEHSFSEDARALIRNLLDLKNPTPDGFDLYVLITMRSDFIGDCAQFIDLAEVVSQSQFLLPRMTRDQRREAICHPVSDRVEPALVQALLNATDDQSDDLPVMQHALMRCWHSAEWRRANSEYTAPSLELSDYRRIGGIEAALSKHADEVYQKLMDNAPAKGPDLSPIVELTFRALTDIDADGRAIRRPQRFAALVQLVGQDISAVRRVVERFCAPDCAFLTLSDRILSDDAVVDVSHEALIRLWRRLSDPARDPVTNEPLGWLWQEFEDGQRWRALAVQARMFRDDKTKRATLSPATTEVYEPWWPKRTPAWAARYARDKKLASEEYREVKDLWEASEKALELERTRLRPKGAPLGDQIALLRLGVHAWNTWRRENAGFSPDLRQADFHGADLSAANLISTTFREADLRGANLRGADLTAADLSGAALSGADIMNGNLTRANLQGSNLQEARFRNALLAGANLTGANLRRADLGSANLVEANFARADLSEADLAGADLTKADLSRTNLRGANLQGADLSYASLVEANLTDADLTHCRIYGISAWGLTLTAGTRQRDLVITDANHPEVTVDNIETAQFVYLLLHNENIHELLDTVTSKAVLILGRFTSERTIILHALRDELRSRGYAPILLDFDKPVSKDVTGTVSTLAHMARFIIAHVTDPSSIPHELALVAPTVAIPIQPILMTGKSEFAMFADFRRRYHWVLPTYRYHSPAQLIADLGDRVIRPAEEKVLELGQTRSG